MEEFGDFAQEEGSPVEDIVKEISDVGVAFFIFFIFLYFFCGESIGDW